METPTELPPRERIWAFAQSLGFDVMGVARADVALEPEHERYVAFIEAGKHGEMAYLANHQLARKRLDTEHILKGAKSVICLGRLYARPKAEEERDPPLAKGIARYARGRDYHNHLRKRLRQLARFVRELGEGVEARPLCDIEPVLERAWASRAGLGFVGKHGLVITPGLGSYQLLGEVVTNLLLPPDTPIAERCGSCTRCLDACPTQAFDAPFVLDARKCLAYLTIERKVPMEQGWVAAAGEHLFGCDDCQDVCPFNQTPAARTNHPEAFTPQASWSDTTLASLISADERTHLALTEGSPLRRPGREALAGRAAQLATTRLAGALESGAEPSDEDVAAVIAGLAHASAVVRGATEQALNGLSSRLKNQAWARVQRPE